MQRIKINFRIKTNHGPCCTWKVYTSKRSPKTKKSIQIHIGYINDSQPIPPGIREKITKKLRAKWLNEFGHKDVEIDWLDAEEKFSRKILFQKQKVEYVNTISKSRHKESVILFFLWDSELNPGKYTWNHTSNSKRTSLISIELATGLSKNSIRDTLDQLLKSGFVKNYDEEIMMTSKGELALKQNSPELFK